MTEIPYWPALHLRRVANGWIVERGPDYSRDRTYSESSEVYCFAEWRACEQFMAQVMEPARPGP